MYDADYGISLLNDTTVDFDFDNSVDLSKCAIEVHYYDMMGTTHYRQVKCDSKGQFYMGKPNDFATFNLIKIVVPEASLPPAGTYACHISFGDYNVAYDYKNVNVNFQRKLSNAKVEYTANTNVDYVTNGNGSFDADFIVNVTASSSAMYMRCQTTSGTVSFPLSGSLGVTFKTSTSKADVTGFTTDYSNTMMDSTNQLVSNTSDINDSLKEIVSQISNQLAALWDQMYNIMHKEQIANDNANTIKITDSVSDAATTITDNADDNTERVTTAIEDHGNFIIDGLKSLFIPSDEYFKSWFDDIYSFFNERLGFLMLPVDILKRFIDIFTASSSGFSGIPFPEFKWIDGTVVIPAQTVGFDYLNTDFGKEIQSKMYFVGNIIMIGALFHLIQQKLKEVLER